MNSGSCRQRQIVERWTPSVSAISSIRNPGYRKQYEEKLGTSAQGWTPARANAERSRRINGQKLTNNDRRQAQLEAKRNAESRPTIERLWQLYLESKGDQLKGVVTDKNRFDLHLRKPVGNKTP